MKDRYIRIQDALDAFGLSEKTRKYGGDHSGYDTRMLYEIQDTIESLEPADVAPVVHAYWIPQKENHEFKEAWMKCSACGYPVSRWTGNTNFCPNCGAKMDAQREEQVGWMRENSQNRKKQNCFKKPCISLLGFQYPCSYYAELQLYIKRSWGMIDEYIRKQDAIRLAEQGQVQGFPWQFQMLVRLPPADVAPVVRCRDCENWDTSWTPSEPDTHYCCIVDNLMKPDFFCCYGKRREE